MLSRTIATTLRHLVVLCPSLIQASPISHRQFPSVGACSGQCRGRLHDPAVVYRPETETYYRFCTNDGINTATASSLSGPWTDQGAALPNGSSINLPGKKDLWAPDVFSFEGTYYLYYSVSQIGSKDSDIGVATSKTLDPGSWADHGSIGIPESSKYNRIDANLFMFDRTAPVLNFGSFWENIFQIPMENPPLRVAGSPVHIAQSTTDRGSGLTKGAMEGGYEFYWNSYHYLFFSVGNCCNEPTPDGEGLAPPGEEYSIMVCRSSSQSGGFVDRKGRNCVTENGGTLLLASHGDVYAPGGQGVMWDAKEQSVVIYYHYVKPSVSYKYDDFFFGWSKLEFGRDGWPVVVS